MLLHATRSKTAFHLAIGQHLMVRSKIEPLWVVLEASNVGHVSQLFVINQLVILACPHVHAAKQRSFSSPLHGSLGSLISAIRQNGHSNAIARTSKRHTSRKRDAARTSKLHLEVFNPNVTLKTAWGIRIHGSGPSNGGLRSCGQSVSTSTPPVIESHDEK